MTASLGSGSTARLRLVGAYVIKAAGGTSRQSETSVTPPVELR